MNPGYGMFQQQAARMRMTPQLRQAVRLLQLSTPELLDYVRQELQENPVLEVAGETLELYGPDVGMQPFLSSRAAGGPDPDYDPLQQAAWNDESLERYLKEQLSFMTSVPRRLRPIVTYMIGNLNACGYLEPALEEIAEALQTGPGEAEQALAVLQSLEPAGIGARNLRECLLLQIRQLPDCPPLVPVLVEEHLEELARLPVARLAARLQASPQETQAAADVIKGLNPRPGAAFHPGEVKYILPDVIIEKSGDRFAVTVNDAAAPRLSVNGQYARMVRENGAGRYNDFKPLRDKLNSALFFVRCMEQRRETLLRVTRVIVEEQVEFFRNGISCLKPMNLSTVADRLGLHESTVSRATSGKYAQTPWGVFELTFFFPSGLQKGLGEAASAESVKARIKEWVGLENNAKPYSDQAIAELLSGEGIRISRRTVTKYREELGIPSSVRRRR
ncbi:RNA polymerase factor sigma-54 [Paenibacillus sp. P26]|nr:RNA polymerase factor sigma-54 [Paenibacillus sp. P26]